ncbi:MAG: 50S ribosomal protein L28 [Planctomycetota bacterium]|nr:MAG: 50S ribosomal protein L28 [Planctomycetota bacterium]
MSLACEVCGKKTTFGNKVAYHGIAKKKGGIGMYIKARTKRKIKANIQKIRIVTDNGTVKKSKVCTRCIKSDKVNKA